MIPCFTVVARLSTWLSLTEVSTTYMDIMVPTLPMYNYIPILYSSDIRRSRPNTIPLQSLDQLVPQNASKPRHNIDSSKISRYTKQLGYNCSHTKHFMSWTLSSSSSLDD